MVNVAYSSKFLRLLGKLPKSIQDQAQSREVIFKTNPFDSRLGTHKLHGKDREHWAYWVTRKIRIKFIFSGTNEILYLEIGTHDQVY